MMAMKSPQSLNISEGLASGTFFPALVRQKFKGCGTSDIAKLVMRSTTGLVSGLAWCALIMTEKELRGWVQ